MADEDSMIYTDEQKLRQILINLIKNAIKFTHQGYVKFGYKMNEHNLVFSVKDTGIGIEKKHHELIFDRFRQADVDNTREYGGTGLGLSISKSLVEILGGKIWLESEPKEGSTFYILIPYNTKTHSQKIKSKLSSGNNLVPDLTSIKILIAEDDENNYDFIHKVLSQTKAELIYAKNGLEALTIVKNSQHLDLIIMDIKMPVMDGLKATREIRKINTTIPIIAVTAYAMKEEKMISLSAGCNDYLPKPIVIDDLFMKIIQHLLQRSKN